MRKMALLLFLAVPSAGLAEIEVTPFVGYRGGGFDFVTGIDCFQSPCPNRGFSDDSLLFGAAVNVPVGTNWDFEVSLNHQPTEIALRESETAPLADRAELNLTRLQVGALRSWHVRALRPYAVAAIGITRLDSDPVFVAGRLGAIEENRASASLGGGVKLGLTRRLGLRLEGRGHWVDLPPALGGSSTDLETTTGLIVNW